MWQEIGGWLLIGFVVLFFGSCVVAPLVLAPRTKSPQFTRGLGFMILGVEILLVCGIVEAPMFAMFFGALRFSGGLTVPRWTYRESRS